MSKFVGANNNNQIQKKRELKLTIHMSDSNSPMI